MGAVQDSIRDKFQEWLEFNPKIARTIIENGPFPSGENIFAAIRIPSRLNSISRSTIIPSAPLSGISFPLVYFS